MNHIRNAVVAVATAAALSMVAACGTEAPAADISGAGNQKSDSPAPKVPVRTNLHRLDFGDGEATLPAQPKAHADHNTSRLDFRDDGRP